MAVAATAALVSESAVAGDVQGYHVLPVAVDGESGKERRDSRLLSRGSERTRADTAARGFHRTYAESWKSRLCAA